jgi:hypothetical protein
MENNQKKGRQAESVIIDYRSLLTWIGTAILFYCLLSGLVIAILPFGTYAQYSIIVHTIVGLVATLPLIFIEYLHLKRRWAESAMTVARIALASVLMLGLCLATGLYMAATGFFGIRVPAIAGTLHLMFGVTLGALLVIHLLPMIRRYGHATPTPRRAPRKRFLATGIVIVLVLFGVTGMLSANRAAPQHFQAFADDYEWPHGDDRPFWPSRAAVAGTPWKSGFLDAVSAELGPDIGAEFEKALGGPETDGLRARTATLATTLELDESEVAALDELVEQAISIKQQAGSLKPSSLSGSASCGSSGCHESIYTEWRASAHGFAAEDELFLRVQDLLIESKGVAESRACAGCHDPAALLGGLRSGEASGDLQIFEGNSCITCHSTVETDTEGNGGYVIRPPQRYVFEDYESGLSSAFGKFLIRVYPDQHVAEYKRPLYKTSEFCAACHKQVPPPGEATSAGLAQEQNEYDSWKSGRWYHGDGDPRTVECRECHMPLVEGGDPASGDDVDSYRSPNDGKHRSHRVLASNMYIPATMELPGHEEQVEQTIAWLRGEIDIPEIEDKWTTGPTVTLDIDAPDRIKAGGLVNIKLHLHNNKTGHDFPAGPLDVLESWIELTVEDNLGNMLMELGADRSINPSIDAPVVYKADWYDKQGLPVERHNLWDVVGASYKRVIRSGGSDVVDVPFRCPGIARPRLSESASETGPGERQSDVAFSIKNPEFNELRITARLMFRKANPEFLAKVYEFEPVTQAPVVEIVRATHTIVVEGAKQR